jgi:hypothetical protein
MSVKSNWGDRLINKEVIGNTTFSSCAHVREKPEDELGFCGVIDTFRLGGKYCQSGKVIS